MPAFSLRTTPAARLPGLVALLLLAGATLPAAPASALKVATWNVIAYTDGNFTFRQANLRAVVAAMDPDVIALQELGGGLYAAARDSFLNNVLNVAQPGQWSATTFCSTCESAVFYKPAKVTITFAGAPISTAGPRDVLGVRFRLAGYTSKAAEVRLYSIHFKAGSEVPDSTTRRLECTDLRNNMNLINPAVVTANHLICGDTNFYGDFEGGYQRLTESQADNDGRCQDPLNLPGDWGQYAYRYHHTQSTCSSGCAQSYWSTGGMDDRFDLFLTSPSLQDGQGLDLVPASYTAYGQDGQHYNSSVNAGNYNYAVGIDVANALFGSSDHLPVMITLKAPAKIAAASQLDFGRVLVGATAQQTLSVSDVAVSPADGLDYTLAAPAGFTAPPGPFLHYVDTPANTHAVTMTTATAAARADTLWVNSDAVDSLAKRVLLSGTVLDHAVASLDSATVATQALVDFGTHLEGGFADQPVRVHDQGWDPLQARLAVTAAGISGGDGRFSIVGGFTPVEVGEVGHTWMVRFDAAGATADSTYEATLVLSTADEPVPGAAPASDLTVSLAARRFSGGVDVAERLPERIAFHPPSPNPFRGATTLRFDLPRETGVDLDLFDLSGRRVASILHGSRPAGRHAVRWAPAGPGGGPLQPGLYFASFRADGFSRTRRIALLP